MLLGQTKDRVENVVMSTLLERVDIKDGSNQHRVLAGPFLERRVYWPTLVEEEGKMVSKMRSAIVPKEGSQIFDTLASIEREIRTEIGEENPKSQFHPSNLYLYLIFDRADDEPVVRVGAYKWSVYQRLEEIQNEISTKDPSMLKNGLIFMYDVIIKKIVGDTKRRQFTTKYSVDPDSENNKFMGQIPKELLKYTADELHATLEENDLYKEIFTDEEMKAIKESTIDLEKATKPMSEEEIRNKLRENPIDLSAKNMQGMNYFPQTPRLMKVLNSMELKYLEGEGETEQDDQQEVKEEKKQLFKKEPEEKEKEKEKEKEVKSQEGSTIKRWKTLGE